MLLTEAPAGHSGTVLRISDRDPAILRSLAEAGVGPGIRLTVIEPEQAGHHAVLLHEGSTAQLTAAAANSIWVSA
jgi:DtxR family Mn-dependent transcriptional regulator